jgi:16S rRNA (guanine(966)-N(2))-methyltransferase RsmD
VTRIVAGAAGGRRLAVPPSARPTTDRVREALFNVLAVRLDFDGLRVLDLYAGSGALGLEALSRGAASVLLVDSDRRAAEVITRNIATVGLPGARVRRGQVAAVLGAGALAPVDLVFADPPYDVAGTQIEAVLAGLGGQGWVRPGSVVVVERPASAPALTWPADWEAWPLRRYGDTRLEGAEFLGRDPADAC